MSRLALSEMHSRSANLARCRILLQFGCNPYLSINSLFFYLKEKRKFTTTT